MHCLHTQFKEIGHKHFSTLALLAIGNIVDFASIIGVRTKEKIITIEKPNSTVENKQWRNSKTRENKLAYDN